MGVPGVQEAPEAPGELLPLYNRQRLLLSAVRSMPIEAGQAPFRRGLMSEQARGLFCLQHLFVVTAFKLYVPQDAELRARSTSSICR